MNKTHPMVVAAAVATLLVAVPATSYAARTKTVGTILPVPSGVSVSPDVGAVTVSWNLNPGPRETYTVSSEPTGLGCQVSAKTSCAMADTSSTPYSFSVVASRKGDTDSPPSTSTTPLNPHLVVVVAGQSNATGQQSYAVDPTTGVNYLAAPYANGADANDLITWEPWEILPGNGATPVSLDSPQQVLDGAQGATTIFGPEIGLARQLWADEGHPVTIIKAAYEGSSLAVDWNPEGTGVPPSGLFPAMVAKVQSVMAADASNGQFDVLGSFNWYQGESDAGNVNDAKRYQSRLVKFIAAVRKRLPMAATAPVVLVKEDSTGYDNYSLDSGAVTPAEEAELLKGNAEVRAADDWAAATLPGVVEVDSSGLARVGPMDLHLSNVSELTLGSEMAIAGEPLRP
jgi:Carbohydrate esterase, sialic acid-specific acetylesterase